MSNTIPPGGPDGPEYLEQGGGSPLGSSPRPAGSGRRKAIIAGGAVVALALAGGATAAVVWWSSTGAQPAEALPDSTIAYASIDLDPSGEQKVEALRILKKFPAFNDEINIDTDDDIRKKMFEELNLDEECDGLDYSEDIEPWLGDRAAVAAVDNGGDEPDLAFVVQVKDADAAEEGLDKIWTCPGAEEGGEDGGWSIDGEWAVIAETDKIAQGIADDAGESPLSDDEDYQKWTDAVGDPGVVTMYAAPEAGKFLADAMDSAAMFGMGGAAYSSEEGLDELSDEVMPDEMLEEYRKAFEDFQGAALAVRFEDGAVELEIAGDSAVTEESLPATDTGDDVLATLPEDTAVALGVGLPEGWFSTMMDQFESFAPEGTSVDDMVDQLEAETGIVLPDDVETLFGESTAMALGPDIDPEAFVNSETPDGLPVGAKVKGDPEEIEKVLEKIRAQIGPDADLLISESEGDEIAIGLDEEYVSALLEDGDLGDSEVFQNVVREADDASSIFYVNFDAGSDDGWLATLVGDDQEVVDNLKPLQGVGMSAWVDDDQSHVVLRLTTD